MIAVTIAVSNHTQFSPRGRHNPGHNTQINGIKLWPTVAFNWSWSILNSEISVSTSGEFWEVDGEEIALSYSSENL